MATSLSSCTPTRYPRGWFIVSTAAELSVGEVKALRYWGQDLVLFRGESGAPVVLDAFCPHLGAHLGHGGCVVGDTVKCPFHAWRFDGEGNCTDVPYAKRIPERAKVKSWPVRERNGVILVWHDPEGGAPDYEVPVLEEFGAPGWTDWHMRRLEIKTHPREIIENVADVAHFKFVHKLETVFDFQNEYDGHCATQIMHGQGAGGEIRTRATYFGPAYQITWMDGTFQVRLTNANTQVDENTVHLWFGVMIKFDNLSEEQVQSVRASMALMGLPDFQLDASSVGMIHEAYVAATQAGYYEDVQIWEHKLFRPDPALCDGDGPINKCRKWYAQFYEDRVTA